MSVCIVGCRDDGLEVGAVGDSRSGTCFLRIFSTSILQFMTQDGLLTSLFARITWLWLGWRLPKHGNLMSQFSVCSRSLEANGSINSLIWQGDDQTVLRWPLPSVMAVGLEPGSARYRCIQSLPDLNVSACSVFLKGPVCTHAHTAPDSLEFCGFYFYAYL